MKASNRQTTTFWEYCEAVEAEVALSTEAVIDDIEAVKHCFKMLWSPEECAETLRERREALKL